jgi:hypothetical protein
MATGATNADALTEIWQEGVKEIQSVKDMTAYNAFKAAVGARGEALKKEQQPTPEQQPAFDDDDVPFE